MSEQKKASVTRQLTRVQFDCLIVDGRNAFRVNLDDTMTLDGQWITVTIKDGKRARAHISRVMSCDWD